ncbi:hypothetical protein A2533_01380 [Candidatus Falkowbacteria bacterium RIFOXYD2_FULL_35_9]|uniref:Uncharacterized protein n=1 Tax=Candidatus Falkowbacteria bacterium RIFOXYC2_FULL_36_12 TaxID=1798002 RepID=A0A1F5T054_9BACT|nr:MAG: hypothetical protein A2300_01075 [Candidatus Falkowbacteria bacterium RIFOXYB2_FULL_35_7]OGF32337.1 MAG: hypothetical protein A2478_03375 [Candidatus Falkowbacteria bacterium RIFOXYC2_FULL_36_12]OGF33848.1 MAG: hypothetical protein A2223_00030 [Candidatus Falkowbacteria bacterium RIFOXYA2_FULL_35_8]OGF47255.1 MAG: hypothetical protein A2533_01380 [Candidatus Falkowbacteria bacterium RIFOXYD2_FULL_35_9]
MKEMIKNLITFLFIAFFVFALVLVVCELFSPGFVIYYLNLNLVILLMFLLAVLKIFVNYEKDI